MLVKRMAKRAGITVLVLAILALCLHLFVTWRANEIFSSIVKQISHGEYRSQSKNVSFTYFPLTVSAAYAQLEPTDSSAIKKNYYVVSVDSLNIGITRIWQLLTQKNLDLTSIDIVHPQISVVNNDTTTREKKSFNVPLNEIQNAFMRSLTAFKVDRCRIIDGGITYDQNRNFKQALSINHIYLDIDSLSARASSHNMDTTFSFFAEIKLFIDHPDIQLPDTSIKVDVQNLLVDTRKNIFTVNQFKMSARNSSGSIDSIELSKIKLKNFYWLRWLHEGIVEIDSLSASNGSTFFDFSDRKLFDLKSKDKVKKKKEINIPLVVHAVEINKIQYGLRTLSPSGPFTVQLDGDSLGISEISITKDSAHPVQVGNLAFKVTNFTNNHDDNRKASNFDKLIIDHNDLELQNYHISLDNARIGAGSSLNIPSLRVLNFSLDDLLQYKLKADKLILEKPALVINIHKTEKKRDADEGISKITSSLRPSLDIQKLSIRDASIVLIPHATPTDKISIEDLSTEIDANQLLAANSVMEMIGSATALSSSGFHVTGSNVNLEIRRSELNKKLDGVYLQQVKGRIGQHVELDLHGVSIVDRNQNFDVTKLQSIELDNISVDSGKVMVRTNKNKKNPKKDNRAPALNVHDFHVGNLVFGMEGEEKELTVKNIKLDGRSILVNDGIVSWKNISAITGSAVWKSPNATIYTSSLHVQQPGLVQVKNISFQPKQPSAITELKVPLLSLQTSFMSTEVKNLSAEKLELDKPVFHFDILQEQGDKASPFEFPDFNLKELVLRDPNIVFTKKDSILNDNNTVKTDTGIIVISDIKGKKIGNLLTAAGLRVEMTHPVIVADSSIYSPGHVKLKVSSIAFNGNTKKLDALIDSAQVSQMQFHIEKKSTTEIEDAGAGIANFQYSSTDSFDLRSFAKQGNWWANAGVITQQLKQHSLTVYNPSVSTAYSVISFDSLDMTPIITRDSFWRSYPFEKDYMTLKMGAVQLHNWKAEGWGDSTTFSAQRMSTNDISFLTEKDKTRGPDTVKYRPLLAKSFLGVPFSFSIDTIQISNGFLRHNVIPEKTGREGTIYFTGMNGNLYNVKNYNYALNDSLRFRIHSQLMGQGDLQVGFRQSYIDTLQGFWLRAIMGNMELSALNSLLTPLASVKVDRGRTSSMLLLVEGNDYLAYGSMDLRYNNLRLSLLKNGENKYFLSKFVNSLLNLFVRTKDNQRKNVVFQERLRSKAIYNFWGKIALNGLLANLGIKHDKSQRRKYQKQIKGKKLPDYSGDL